MIARPTLGELIRRALEARLADVHTAIPAEVQAYDKAKQTVDVQPLVKRVVKGDDGTETVESLPQIQAVPVAFPRAGDWFLSLPIAKGDTVLLVFAERSIDQWLAKGGEQDPGDLRLHNLSDAIAIPGVYSSKMPLQDAHAENMVLGMDGGAQIHLKPNGEVHLAEENASDFVALAQATEDRLAALESIMASHVHAGCMPGPSSVAPAVIAPPLNTPPAPVAATKTKAT